MKIERANSCLFDSGFVARRWGREPQERPLELVLLAVTELLLRGGGVRVLDCDTNAPTEDEALRVLELERAMECERVPVFASWRARLNLTAFVGW